MDEYLKYLDENTKDLSNAEKLRYAYIDLGKRFNFDVKYSLETNLRRKSKTYSFSGSYSSVKKSFTSNNIICRDTAEIFRIIGEHLGIDIRTTRFPLDESLDLYHVYNVVTNEDGTKWTMDLQKDLKYIQNHLRTRHFGKKKDNYGYYLNPHDLEVIDRKIGYIDEYYNDDYYDYVMKNDVETIYNFDDKLDLIFSNIEYDGLRIGDNERYFFHSYVVNKLLSESELKALEQITCYKKKGKNNIYFPAFVVMNEKGNVLYIYVFELDERKYNKLTPKEFMSNYYSNKILTKDYSLGAIKLAASEKKVLKI